jgi:hypothetical protein
MMKTTAGIITVGVAVLLAGAGCATEAPRTPLSHTFASPWEAGQAVLDGLARRDYEALHALAVTEQEFREHVWPELPASRPERNMPFDYVWGQSAQRSRDFLRQTFARYEGQRFELLGVEFDGVTTDYPSFSVSRQAVLVVRNADGEEERLRLIGSLMRQGDRYKVYSYIITD